MELLLHFFPREFFISVSSRIGLIGYHGLISVYMLRYGFLLSSSGLLAMAMRTWRTPPRLSSGVWVLGAACRPGPRTIRMPVGVVMPEQNPG